MPSELLTKFMEQSAKQIKYDTLNRILNRKSPYAPIKANRYWVRAYWSGEMNGSGLYSACDSGAKFLLRGAPVKPEHPGDPVFGIWDRDEKKLLTVWPNQQTAENVLRLMQ